MEWPKKPKLKCPFCGQERDALIEDVIGTELVFICKDCLEKKKKEAEQILIKRDMRKLEERAYRQIELGTLTYSSAEKQPPFYLRDLLDEAAESYVEGCFRSCIFICAEIVEQVIKHELIRSSKDPEEKLWQFEIEKKTFGELVKEAEKLPEMRSYVSDARWLNSVRNTIVVHPLYVGVYEKSDDLGTKIWKNRTMIRNIRKTLEFLSELDREWFLENIELRPLEGENFIRLKDMLTDSTSDHVFVIWNFVGKDILQKLALEAYTRMKRIVEGIYSTDKSL